MKLKVNPILFFYASIAWLVLIFIFLPHYIEITGVLETWFPYKGLTYYKDFAAYHFPLGRLVLLPIHIISDWNLEFDPWMGLFAGVGTLYIIYLFGQRFLSAVGTTIAVIFFSIFFWYGATGILFFHEILIGFFLSLIIYVLFQVHDNKKVNSKNLFLLGILISLTELSGQIATITLGIVVILLLYEIIRKQTKNYIASITTLIAGIVLPFLFFSLYFLSKGALGEFYYYNITYYLLYAAYEKGSLLSLPILELTAFYLPLLILFLVSSFALLKKKGTNYQTLYALIFSASTVPLIIFSIYHPHHLNYALPILAITAGIAYDRSKNHKLIFGFGAAVFLLISIMSLIPWHIERMKLSPNFRIANDLYSDSKDPMKNAVNWVKDNTAENAKIMVMGDAMFYLRSDRLPAARPSKGIPWGWNPIYQIEKELIENRPDYWIISGQFMTGLVNHYDRPDIVNFFENELSSCYKLKIKFDYWEIWQKTCE